ncbi:hypothetical protein AYM40_27615 [Paraburkholderia phytofirmans OLGA172]|uniref:Uncharacterized protein n=1 Tax=Paraburkholderia phytofirmans OLGA172 TaxID=1417228 RepID=A0A160FT13_9BURK|nr:hypothetical protein AYM40_27615 [Paraburkholderia phytofirmans OLGA172]
MRRVLALVLKGVAERVGTRKVAVSTLYQDEGVAGDDHPVLKAHTGKHAYVVEWPPRAQRNMSITPDVGFGRGLL